MKTTFCFVLGVLGLATLQVSADPVKIDPWLARIFVSNDFESGTMSPWFDQSPARVNWKVEQFSSPSEADSPAPRPTNGTQYLRATRNADLASGLAVLHSPVFTALPGDKVRFSFWIRSRQPQGNNLELYWAEGNREYFLIGLSQFSSSSNFEWRSVSVDLPFNRSTDISLIFYGFCGSNLEDAVALDNIIVGSSEPTTPEMQTTTPSTIRTTAEYSTPETTELSTITSPKPVSCNVVLNDPGGSFNSPNYPSNYDDNLNCNWLIVTGANTQIVITFRSFFTERDYDFVTIYDGGSTSAPRLGRYSGPVSPSTITSSDNVVLVTFTSDESGTNRGFSAGYTQVSSTTIRTTTDPYFTTGRPYCEYNLYGYGDFNTPNYPNNYPNNVDCYWYLQAEMPNSEGIGLDFYTFSTQSINDYVKAYEGWSMSGTLLLSASGSSKPGYVYSSRSSRMLVHFHSDGSSTAQGFKAYFWPYSVNSETPTPTPEVTTNGWMTGTPMWCDGELTSDSGELTSPFYPSTYPNDFVCETRIRVSPGRRIRVSFIDFSVEERHDVLTIYDGPTIGPSVLLTASGSTIPAPFTSSSNQIYVRFTTDGSVPDRGWRLTYSAV